MSVGVSAAGCSITSYTISIDPAIRASSWNTVHSVLYGLRVDLYSSLNFRKYVNSVVAGALGAAAAASGAGAGAGVL